MHQALNVTDSASWTIFVVVGEFEVIGRPYKCFSPRPRPSLAGKTKVNGGFCGICPPAVRFVTNDKSTHRNYVACRIRRVSETVRHVHHHIGRHIVSEIRYDMTFEPISVPYRLRETRLLPNLRTWSSPRKASVVINNIRHNDC